MSDYPKDKFNNLILLYNKNKFDELKSRIIVERLSFPKSIALLNLQGAVYVKLKKFNLAHNCYKLAIEINKNSPEIFHNFGYLLKLEGNTSEAIKYFKKATEMNPNYDEAFNNLGVCYHHEKNFSKAIYHYKEALKINPKRYDVFNNLGIAFYENGNKELAIEYYKSSLKLHPNNNEVYFNLGIALTNYQFVKHEYEFYPILEKLLNNNYTRPRNLSLSIISLVKLNPEIEKVVKNFNKNKISVIDIIKSLMNVKCFINFLRESLLCDLELENILRKIRSELLFSIYKVPESSLVNNFQILLASHCYLNEYIYSINDKEMRCLEVLEQKVVETFKRNKQPNYKEILCLASYKALHNYNWNNLLKNKNEIDTVFQNQILDKNKEDKLKLTIKKLEKVSNKISITVKEQYEENPYPRWKSFQKPLKPKNLNDICKELNLKINNSMISKIHKPCILIAGCGTGQQSIEAALKYKNCSVVAIDISTNSLAYAKKKSEEFGFKNIKYIQADILDLKKLNLKFDLIHCTGVLHHMEKPLVGLKVLSDILNKNGLIKLGYYSELARKHIIKIRKEIQHLGISNYHEDIIRFRDFLTKSKEKHHIAVTHYHDFYSLSAIRDMLFHVQEKRYNLLQINNDLNKCKLKFCGFDEKKIVDKFISLSESKEDLYSLNKWNSYELKNPDTFMGMYQFWSQKVL